MSAFWGGFSKRASTREVASVALIRDGKVLMGKRRDNGKWTTPGGHLEKGETPVEGAVREVEEEAGIRLKPSVLVRLTTKTVHTPEGKILRVHGYRANLQKEVSTSMANDPDNEVYRWHWMQFRPFRREIAENMHVPKDNNVLWKGIGAILPEEKTANQRRRFHNFYLKRAVPEKTASSGILPDDDAFIKAAKSPTERFTRRLKKRLNQGTKGGETYGQWRERIGW